MSIFKVHFIRTISIRNAGDMACGPYLYFSEFTDRFICSFHDMSRIDYNDINENDVVIIGASGLLDVSEEYVSAINLLFERCKNVIAWSVGHNKHFGFEINEKIDYNRFVFLTVRDYGYENQVYLPCVTCMISGLEKKYAIKRRIGVIEHTNYPIREFDFERISNSCALSNIIDFIGSSEVIISNSYHVIYWTQLMGKKAILYNSFSEKFDYYEHKPVRYSGDIEFDIEKSEIYPDFLEKCREKNILFSKKIIDLIENVIPKEEKVNYEFLIRNSLNDFSKLLEGKRVIICGTEYQATKSKDILLGDYFFEGFCTIEVPEMSELPFINFENVTSSMADIFLVVSYSNHEVMKKKMCEKVCEDNVIDIYDYFESKSITLSRDFYDYYSRVFITPKKVDMDFILWGIGERSRKFFKEYAIPLENMKMVVDSMNNENQFFYGKKVERPESIKDSLCKLIVVGSDKYYSEISREVDLNYSDCKVINIDDYVVGMKKNCFRLSILEDC